jgi:cysteine sulfinate desulfinase/cysteine desulfurase-like protein
MGMSEERAKSCVRFSFGKGNDEEQAKKAAEILKEIVEELRAK